jgi:hypothetical protein
MKIDIAKRLSLAAAAATVGLAMSGCAGLGKPATPEQQVKARAQQRADALVKRDLNRAYEFTRLSRCGFCRDLPGLDRQGPGAGVGAGGVGGMRVVGKMHRQGPGRDKAPCRPPLYRYYHDVWR